MKKTTGQEAQTDTSTQTDASTKDKIKRNNRYRFTAKSGELEKFENPEKLEKLKTSEPSGVQFAQSTSNFFCDPKMKDIAIVGEDKALGYLPLSTIHEAGYEVFQISMLLKKKGLKYFLIPKAFDDELYAYNPEISKFVHIADGKKYEVIPKGGFLSIKSGALVVYDEEAVTKFLHNNETLIASENLNVTVAENKWPMNAGDFVNMLFRKMAKSKEMDNLIHTIYKEMPKTSSPELK